MEHLNTSPFNQPFSEYNSDLLKNILSQTENIQTILDGLVGGKTTTEAPAPAKVNSHSTADLAKFAKNLHKSRSRRSKFINKDLLGEPSWDILLDLYSRSETGKHVSITSCCIGAGVPYTTALRWISMLERLNLIERSPDLNDKRRGFVSLTQHGADTMKNALSDMAGLLS